VTQCSLPPRAAGLTALCVSPDSSLVEPRTTREVSEERMNEARLVISVPARCRWPGGESPPLDA
jgi:hypothetical protein